MLILPFLCDHRMPERRLVDTLSVRSESDHVLISASHQHMFQKAIHTVEGVKADYIFSYPIP